MSEVSFVSCPTVPDWVPAQDAADAAAEVVSAMCPSAGELVACRYADGMFIDQGANFEAVGCPVCAAPLDVHWWQERMDDAYATRFATLDTVTPVHRDDHQQVYARLRVDTETNALQPAHRYVGPRLIEVPPRLWRRDDRGCQELPWRGGPTGPRPLPLPGPRRPGRSLR